jgi:hypothetical protein
MVYGHLVDFSRFGKLCQEKSANPAVEKPQECVAPTELMKSSRRRYFHSFGGKQKNGHSVSD